jgi:hypothetical protein
MNWNNSDGRDELNLAEFPISAIGTRLGGKAIDKVIYLSFALA